jgi:hypothetical protein
VVRGAIGQPFGWVFVSLLAVAGSAHCEKLRAGQAVKSSGQHEVSYVALIHWLADRQVDGQVRTDRTIDPDGMNGQHELTYSFANS